MTQHPEIFAALAAPFEEAETKQRKGTGNEYLRYVTAPTVMNRLDNVLGPENWDDETAPVGGGSPNYRCKLTIRLPDGAVAIKTGVGSPGSTQAKADPGKAAASDAFKRAAVKFGVGRYLYRDGVPAFARQHGLDGPAVPGPVPRADPRGQATPPPAIPSRAERLVAHCLQSGTMGQAQALARGKFGVAVLANLDDDQALAVWKLLKVAAVVPPDQIRQPPPPAHVHAPAPAPAPAGLRTENGGPVQFGWPTHGGALYGWAKNLEQAFSIAVVRKLDDHARVRKWPTMYNQWSPEQVEEGAKVAARLVQSLPGYDGQFDAHAPGLIAVKGALLARTTELLVHLGNAEPTYDDLKHSIRARSEGLAAAVAGGEVVADFDACEDLHLLEAVLAAVTADVADADAIAF